MVGLGSQSNSERKDRQGEGRLGWRSAGGRKFRLLPAIVALGALAVAGCGGGSYSSTPPKQPSISSLSPNTATAGSTGFTLTINGSNFTADTQVGWSNPGNPGFTGGAGAYGDGTKLTLMISAAEIAIPGQVTVTVSNSQGTSMGEPFIIKPGAAGGAKAVGLGVGGAAPNGNASMPALSLNGRFLAYASESTNLVAGGTQFAEGFVEDTCLGADNCTPSTLLISAATGGNASQPTEGNSLGGADPSISFQGFTSVPIGTPAAGQYFGFLSAATNLVSPSASFQQGYFRNTCFLGGALGSCTPQTVMVSTTQSGSEPNGAATDIVMAGNGCNAAFVSSGTDVLSGVTNPNEIYLSKCGLNGASFQFTTTALVSASTSGTAGDQGAQEPAISADGRFVAFASTSTNLTTTSNAGAQQIYLRDTCLSGPPGCVPTTTLVSLDSTGNVINGSSLFPAISDDGRFVVFTAMPLLQPAGVGSIVYLRDNCVSSSGAVAGCSPSTTTISVAANGGAANNLSSSSRNAMSGDGRFVAFESSATNLLSAGNTTGNQIYVRDTCQTTAGIVPQCAPTTALVSLNGAGPTQGFRPAISHDGHTVAYQLENGVVEILVANTGF